MDVKSVNQAAATPPPKAQKVKEPTPEQKNVQAKQEQPHRTEAQRRPVVNAQGQTTGRLVNTTA